MRRQTISSILRHSEARLHLAEEVQGWGRGVASLLSQAMCRSVRFVVMPRRRWFDSGGFAYHVLNRAVARDRLFRKPADYQVFEDVLEEAKDERVARSETGHSGALSRAVQIVPGSDGQSLLSEKGVGSL